MAKYLYLAFSDPVAGKEAEFDRWFDDTHIPNLLAVPGVVSAQRFAAVDAGDGAPARRRHAAIYELETSDPRSVLEEIARRRNTERMVPSDALDASSLFTRILAPIRPRRAAESSIPDSATQKR